MEIFGFLIPRLLFDGYDTTTQPQIHVRFAPGMYENPHLFYHFLTPVKFIEMSLRVPRGSTFTPMEKLAKPFDDATWIVLIVTLSSGLIVIFLLNFSTIARNFVFGNEVQDPYFSFIQIFYGIGLVVTPSRNFARFLFMMFTILCLVVRTAYQGKMFDFLQYDIKQPIANTLQEVIDKQIPVIMDESFLFEYDAANVKAA
jgi:hypothetical protein